jgi:hypothetical protein
MMRTLRSSACLAIAAVVAAVLGMSGTAGAAVVVGEDGPVGPQPAGVVAAVPAASTVIRLSRLHHVARREIDLGRVAQTSGSRPETRGYGTRLVSDFQALDDRIVAMASALGIQATALEPIYAGENTAALARESEDLTRLAAQHGDAFDRLFWVVVAHDQLAAADMLLPVAGADPRLEPIVTDMSRQLDTSSQLALVAARPVAAPASTNVPSPAVPSPDVPPAPVTTPGSAGVRPPSGPGGIVTPPPAR